MKDTHYSAAEVQRIARVKKSSLKNWITAGAIKPLHDARGRGKRRKFSHNNVLDVMVCRELSLFGFPPKVFPLILYLIEKESAWEKISEDPLTFYFLVVPLWRSIDVKTGVYTSAMPVPKLLPAQAPEDLGHVVSESITTLTINLTQLAKDAGAG